MTQAFELPSFNIESNQAIPLIIDLLIGIGFHILPSFDLQAARASQTPCKCPHHGTEKCDCQMVVILIYGDGNQPASMVIHGHDGKTFLSLVDVPQQRPDPEMLRRIQDVLAANASAR